MSACTGEVSELPGDAAAAVEPAAAVPPAPGAQVTGSGAARQPSPAAEPETAATTTTAGTASGVLPEYAAVPPEAPPVETPPANETPPPANETPPPANETPPPANETPPPANETPPAETTPPAQPPAPDPNAGWVAIAQGTQRVRYPRGVTGGTSGGLVFNVPIASGTRYRLRYEVMPEGNFDFRAGGKLPGLAGGGAPTGGSDATNGWSGRLMWNHGGRLSFYFYRATGGSGGIDTGGYGTHWYWAADAVLVPGQWNTIEIGVDHQTGETVGYLNGTEKARQNLHYQWPRTDLMMFSTFFGGQGSAYEPSKDEHMSFRNMSVKPGG